MLSYVLICVDFAFFIQVTLFYYISLILFIYI